MLIVALRTGLRHDELIGLGWLDADLDADLGRMGIAERMGDRPAAGAPHRAAP